VLSFACNVDEGLRSCSENAYRPLDGEMSFEQSGRHTTVPVLSFIYKLGVFGLYLKQDPLTMQEDLHMETL
jgi:hypothetical protein